MLQPLAKLPKLHTLIVDGNPGVSPEVVAGIVQSSEQAIVP
ncbi:MAG: hypothetical protein QF805_23150 [Pirellulaceae bacterium]|jgi:hypothetical protein|nr:hypothetical protein [Pirellulaceae bacterium]